MADGLLDLFKGQEYGGGQSLWDRKLLYVASDFGRSKGRPANAEDFGTAHDLNDGVLLISPLVRGSTVLGGVDPDTAMTYGFDPHTGAPVRGRHMTEPEIYAGSRCDGRPMWSRMSVTPDVVGLNPPPPMPSLFTILYPDAHPPNNLQNPTFQYRSGDFPVARADLCYAWYVMKGMPLWRGEVEEYRQDPAAVASGRPGEKGRPAPGHDARIKRHGARSFYDAFNNVQQRIKT